MLIILVHQLQMLGSARGVVGLAHGNEQVVDDFVAYGSDANPLACRGERQDGLSALCCLSGSGRPLYRQYAAVQFATYAHKGLDGVLIGTAQRFDPRTAARRTRTQELTRSSVGTVIVKPVVADMFGEGEHCLLKRLGADHWIFEN